MDVQQLRDDATAGKLSLNKLIDVIAAQQKRIAELETIIKSKNPTERLQEPYSEKAEEKRKSKQGRKKKRKPLRRGRISTAEKIKQAKPTETVFPDSVPREECKFSHTRVAWRLEEGHAVLVA